jgi:exodeoxyribonuclease-5
MRQEEGSEIIQLSMKIRNHEPLELFQGKNVQVIDKSQLVSGVLTWADQIIVAKNNTRIEYNNKLREMLGYGPEPQEGDKVVCLRNYWDECSVEERDALVNGTIGYLKHPTNKTIFFPKFLKLQCGKSVIATTADIVTPEGDYYPHIDCDKKMIVEGEKCMDWRDSYALGKLKDRYGDLVPKEITYGYAITCWKAQGSQWDKVLLFEENFPFDKEEHFRYLYTGITRAINKIVVVRK